MHRVDVEVLTVQRRYHHQFEDHLENGVQGSDLQGEVKGQSADGSPVTHGGQSKKLLSPEYLPRNLCPESETFCADGEKIRPQCSSLSRPFRPSIILFENKL